MLLAELFSNFFNIIKLANHQPLYLFWAYFDFRFKHLEVYFLFPLLLLLRLVLDNLLILLRAFTFAIIPL